MIFLFVASIWDMWKKQRHDCSAYSRLAFLEILGHLSRENMLQEDAGIFSRMM
jgi:hypothetical protein